jgi:hypothetical protein
VRATPRTTSPSTIPAKAGPVQKSEFDKRVEEYQSLVAELKREVAEYRASFPIKEFREVFEQKIASMVIEGEQADHQAETTYGHRRSLFDSQKEYNTTIGTILPFLVSSYGETPKVVLDLYRSGKVEHEDPFATFTLRAVMKYSGESVRSDELKNPFDKGTSKALEFERELGRAASAVSKGLWSQLCNLPPDLQEKERRVRELYKQIIGDMPFAGGLRLPEKYVDEERTMIDDHLDKLRKAPKLKRIRDYFRSE